MGRRRGQADRCALLALAGMAAACVPVMFGSHAAPGTAPNSATPWTPSPKLHLPAAVAPNTFALPDGFFLDKVKEGPLTLPAIVKIALEYNLATRDAWLKAVVQANQVGIARAAWFPTLEWDTGLTTTKQNIAGAIDYNLTTLSPTLNLSYLVLDFGARQARVHEARDELVAVDWTHNAVLQNVVLQVEQSYFQVLNAKAQLQVQRASAKEQQTALDAATAREQVGLATQADVLQAKTALSQVLFNIATVEGQIRTFLGGLNVAMGLPPNVPISVGELPEVVPLEAIHTAVDEYLKRGVAQRPDLAAARSRVEEAQARITELYSGFLPSISLQASANRTYFLIRGQRAGGGDLADNYSASLSLAIPIFSGFSTYYGVEQAKVQARDAQVQANFLQQQIELQVWTSYFALVTCQQQLSAARDLLASAKASLDVAAGQYQVGVGNILSFLTAESALVTARGQEVQARATWFLALAQLAHDTGALGLPSDESPVPPGFPGGQRRP